MTNISKHDLDSRAIDWIKELLSVNTSLSNILLKSLPFNSGRVWTYGPNDVDTNDLYKFSSGGIIKNNEHRAQNIYKGGDRYVVEGKCDCTELISLYIKGLFDDEGIKLCVFEDIMARPSDPDVEGRLSGSALVSDHEVYHVVRAGNFDLKKIQMIVTAVNVSWHFLCVGFKDYVDLKEAGLKEISNIIGDLAVLIVGAYDGESFVVWEKT